LIHRRELLQRDPPVDWQATIQGLRDAGYGTGTLCFVLNIERQMLRKWETKKACPNFENGRALLKLFQSCNQKLTE